MGKGRSRPNSRGSAAPRGGIGFVRGGGIGDVLALTPVLLALRELDPSIEVSCWGRTEVYEVLRERGLVAQVASLDGGPAWRAFSSDASPSDELLGPFEELARLIVFGHPVHPRLAELLGARVATFPAFPEGAPNEPVWRRLLRCVAQTVPELPPEGPRQRAIPRANPGAGAGRLVVLVPGSGALRKNWPSGRFLELAAALAARGRTCRFMLGPAEPPALAATWANAGFAVHRPPDLSATARLLESAEAFVGNDTGPTHLAAQLGVPTVAVFGPASEPAWEPFGPRVAVVRARGPDPWPTADDVLARALALLEPPDLREPPR